MSSEVVRPALTNGRPGPGRFVRVQEPAWEGTGVYHGLYLPVDWKHGGRYPVIIEYSGNEYGEICTGKVDDCRLGFYQSGGRGYVWAVLPFVNAQEKKNQLRWWGDVEATVTYCKKAVRRICQEYGGDPGHVLLTGFSRGAIACGYIGLHDDEIAGLWAGFMPHSHHDGGSYSAEGSGQRLARIGRRPSFITYGSDDSGKNNSLIGAKLLGELDSPVQTVEIAGLAHSDKWIEKDCPTRQALRQWMAGIGVR